MSFQDIFKKSVWESFTANNGLTWDFVITACIALLASIVFGLLIYCVYKRNYAGVVYSKSFGKALNKYGLACTKISRKSDDFARLCSLSYILSKLKSIISGECFFNNCILH